MIKNDNDVLELYDEFSSEKDSRWKFCNKVLYEMCEAEPKHTDSDVIIGKILLIGRSYAAAIERRKTATKENDDFYDDIVAPEMLKIGGELDEKIRELSLSKKDSVKNLLSTHKYLTDVFYSISGLEKRSLASKYLHFHCPSKVFIYDERARRAIQSIVQYPNRDILKEAEQMGYDDEYGDFVCRILELKNFLRSRKGIQLSPRQIDNFLLTKDALKKKRV